MVIIMNNTDSKTNKKIKIPLWKTSVFPASVSFLGILPASINCIDVEVPPEAPRSGDTVGALSSTLLMISVESSNLT